MTTTPRSPNTIAASIIKAVWLSILLGVLVQALIVLATSFNKQTIIPDTAQKISWSVLVCSALAIGNTIAKSKVPIVGLIGLIAAPAAFAIAKTVQKSLSQGVSAGGGVPSGLEMAIVKAIEYGLFGALVAWASKAGKLKTHLIIGASLGISTAAYVVWRTKVGTPQAPNAALISKTINEVVFPIGCALVLWFTGQASRILTPATETKSTSFSTP
jgi:hypothetical protein